MGFAMYNVLHNPRIVITQLPLTLDYFCYLEADDYDTFEPIYISQSHDSVCAYVNRVFPFLKQVERKLLVVPADEVLVL